MSPLGGNWQWRWVHKQTGLLRIWWLYWKGKVHETDIREQHSHVQHSCTTFLCSATAAPHIGMAIEILYLLIMIYTNFLLCYITLICLRFNILKFDFITCQCDSQCVRTVSIANINRAAQTTEHYVQNNFQNYNTVKYLPTLLKKRLHTHTGTQCLVKVVKMEVLWAHTLYEKKNPSKSP